MLSRFLILLFLITHLDSVLAKEEITWVKWNLVPEYIESGPYQNTGYLDNFLQYVQQRLSEYTHHEEFQTLNRINRSWAKGNVCSLHLWLGYWPDKIVYSNPYGFTPRFGIVTDKDSKLARQFEDQGSISLKFLLEQTNYKLGMLPLYYEGSKDSRYPLMAPLIEQYLSTPLVNEFHNNKNEVGVAYLEKKRVDYIIRQRITHFAELKTEQKRNNYRFFFLDEGRRHKLVASACSNSALGREVIAKINTLIDEEFYLRYLRYRREWDANNPSFDQTFSDYFLKNKAVDYVTK